ncbi:MAG TPA: N-acetyltransferase [Caulobacteraceae bacterium]|jgi:predicted N-acetyltransferase YhbS
MSLAHAPSPPRLSPERPQDAPAVDAVILRAFGPGRFAKAAERLREGREPLRELSFVAWDGERILGCVRLWAVTIGGAPAVLLGPIAVEAAARSQGLGATLVERACEAAEAAGHRLVVLVGDEPFFGPLGFAVTPRIAMPGPVDRRRVMLRALAAGADVGVEGLVAAA